MLLFFNFIFLSKSFLGILGLNQWQERIGEIQLDYKTTDLLSLVDQIADKYHLERDRVELFFRLCKHSSSSMQLFHRFESQKESK